MPNSRPLPLLLAVLAFANLALAQAAPSPAAQKPQAAPVERGDEEEEEGRAAPAPRTAAELPPTTPVIIIRGVCAVPKTGTAAKAECKTLITRAEFEKLTNTFQPNMPPQVRKQLANRYPQVLYMSQEARKQGLENDPHYLEMLKYTKMELLARELDRALEEQASKVPEAEIEDYYDKNSRNFEETSILRVFVPRTKQTEAAKEGASAAESDAARKESEAAMAKVADDLRTRAAAGEDFDQLQKDAYEAAGITSAVPPTSNSKVRRGNLPPAQASVFDLKPGELSAVINDPSGYYIFKVKSKTTPPLAELKDEIRNTLRSQRMQAMRQKMQSSMSSELNPEYFGGDAAPVPPGAKGSPRSLPGNRMRPTPAPPASQPKE